MRDANTGTGVKYKCLLLIRVSTTKQTQAGESPEHQLKRGLDTALRRFNAALDLSRFRAAPGSRLGDFSLESDGTFPAEG